MQTMGLQGSIATGGLVKRVPRAEMEVQHVWGTRYVDEVLFMDVNGRPDLESDCNPDVQTPAEQTQQTADSDCRYFYHQDRNWNVVALTAYDPNNPNGGTNGRVVERYAYTPYGEFVVTTGDAGSGELGGVRPASTVGNPFAHQALYFDQEKGCYQNRHREYAPQRFAQRDPLPHPDLFNQLYLYVRGNPASQIDALGLLPPDPGIAECCIPWFHPCCYCGQEVTGAFAVGPIDAIMCAWDAAAADSAAKATYGQNCEDNQCDAFRHCYGQCLATLDVGAAQAQKCGDVHEMCSPNQPGAEHMDQHNNALGRSFGSAPGATASSCYTNCQAAVSAAGPGNCPPATNPPANAAQTCPGGPKPPNPTYPGC